MTSTERTNLLKAVIASVIDIIDQADRDGARSPCPGIAIKFVTEPSEPSEFVEYVQELVEDERGIFQPQPITLR